MTAIKNELDPAVIAAGEIRRPANRCDIHREPG